MLGWIQTKQMANSFLYWVFMHVIWILLVCPGNSLKPITCLPIPILCRVREGGATWQIKDSCWQKLVKMFIYLCFELYRYNGCSVGQMKCVFSLRGVQVWLLFLQVMFRLELKWMELRAFWSCMFSLSQVTKNNLIQGYLYTVLDICQHQFFIKNKAV